MSLLAPDAYDRWWQDNTDDDGELLAGLPEPAATLAAHVQALQARIDRLPDPDAANLAELNRRAVRCACAYDHPAAVCMVHRLADSRAPHQTRHTEEAP